MRSKHFIIIIANHAFRAKGGFMSALSSKYWISTVSREHVLIGVDGGFCQMCHGKKGPISRLKPGDWLVYYSPKMSMEGQEKCQKFTAIGQIVDDNIYQYKMTASFVPFRRKVDYIKNVSEQSIVPLLDELSFTKGNKNWGAKFRFGLFEISQEDFKIIKNLMTKSKKRELEEDNIISTDSKKQKKTNNVKEE